MSSSSKQIKIKFDDITKSGLKVFTNRFKKFGCPVEDIISTNKGKRESGMFIKEFTLIFEDGQKLIVRVKYDGTLFQVKLNNKVKPIKNVDDFDKAIGEMIDYIQDNSDAYKRNKISAAKRKVMNTAPAIRTTRAEKMTSTQNNLVELQVLSTELQAEFTLISDNSKGMQKQLDEALKNIEQENKRTDLLQGQIEVLKSKDVI